MEGGHNGVISGFVHAFSINTQQSTIILAAGGTSAPRTEPPLATPAQRSRMGFYGGCVRGGGFGVVVRCEILRMIGNSSKES